MSVKRRLQIGDEVRDCAQLGGEVIETWADRVRVRWNNGIIGWVKSIWLSLRGD